MKKWLIRGVFSLFSIFILILAAVLLLLGTRNGTQFLAAQAERQLKGQLVIGSVAGTVLDRLELGDVSFTSPAGTVALGRLVLDWKSTQLFRLHFHILELVADDVSYHLGPQVLDEPEIEASEPFVLPELTLPVTITLEKGRVNDVVFLSRPEAEPLVIESVRLALFWDKSGIQLQQLGVKMAAGSLQGQGQLNPVGKYPLHLETQLETLAEALPKVQINGEYAGDLQELVVTERISGDVSADLNVRVQQVLEALSWQGDLELSELTPAIFSPEVPGKLTGNIRTTGNLQQAAVAGVLSMRDPAKSMVNWDANLDLQANLKNLSFAVNELTLKQVETSASIALQGTVDNVQHLDISMHWQDLQWPVTGEADLYSVQGELLLAGQVDAYQLTLDSEAGGAQIPSATLQLEAQGNTEQLDIARCIVNTLEGEVGMQGRVTWAPQISWQLKTDGQGINPGMQYEQWPGKLAWAIQTVGELTDQGAVADVEISSLEGHLRELPVSGSGDVRIQPNEIHINGLKLASGQAVFSAQGALGDDSTLNWHMKVADFSDLLPDAGGRLNAQGTVSGKMTRPQVAVKASAGTLVMPGFAVEHLQADGAFDLSWNEPFALELTATGLEAGGKKVNQINLHGNGTIENHFVELSASHELADLSLDLQGGYRDEQWQGQLNTFSVHGNDIGGWQLANPAKIYGSTTAAKLETFCLKREMAEVCAGGSWNSDNTKTRGEVSVDGFLLAWLSPWFPETLESLDGVFSLKGSADMADSLRADVKGAITPGSIGYLMDSGKGTLPHEGVQVALHVSDGALDAEYQLGVDSNVIRGTLRSFDLLTAPEITSAKVSGELLIDATKFDIVEALVPDVQELNGAVAVRLTLGGSLGQPDVSGEGKITLAHVLIPVAGLDLSDTNLDLVAENKDLKLQGIFNSPEGYLELEGRAVLDGGQNWPLHCTFKGENFRLVNLPDMQLYLSSDLLLEKKSDGLSLTGEAIIPRADVWLQNVPEGTASVSPDVIIIQEEADETKQTMPLQMKLKISLGKDVHFVGFGLDTFIDGQLTLVAEPEEELTGSGNIQIKQGTYRAYGQDLDIQTGVISFAGGPLSKPGVNLRATRTIGAVLVGVNAIGPAAKPRLIMFSNPVMAESSILSYLLTGSAPSDVGGGTKLSLERQINSKLLLSVGTDVKTGENEIITRYRLNRKIYVQATTATNSNAADIFYTSEFGGDSVGVVEKKETE